MFYRKETKIHFMSFANKVDNFQAAIRGLFQYENFRKSFRIEIE